MPTAPHSPLPWILNRNGVSIYCHPGPSHLISVAGTDSDQGTDRANAAFIVKACNSHDALVAAAERLMRCNAQDGNWAERGEADWDGAINQLSKALAAAQGDA